MPSPNSSPLLAVLIDADNVLARHAEAILKEISTIGEPALRRVYGDWSSTQLAGWKVQARDLGLVMHQQSANTKGKNASDIGLVIDAMDILHAGKFDAFVLVSSDSDFTRLASRIREEGLEVIGIGEAKTPESLRKVCNRFILIENIVGDAEPEAKPARAAAAAPKQDAPAPQPSKRPESEAIPLIRKAMTTIDPDGEWFSLGQIGQYMVRADPDFDARTYGSPRLSDLVKRLTKRFEVRKDGNQLMVRDIA
ncbi:MAG: NYN domain-containing protein [Tabrizicola sp.]|uniref:NYN domain-containing protein n=1 Tax=Tabrizicola sp. TaxID=2005166 RepID=UPI00273716A9|nr:NYN domain-containing protein [Tabrizicola sp.]MDP3264758.1 NYN domain-containing protein [Tabrizicola sp.]MDP3647493.1 NYN domain-containing protein [Paracoccaceae bacterium]MDZ4067028.1 NYN domain-containing protein [Tabrizicola sp.]